MDMATSTVPIGKVEVCHPKGQKMPFGWGVVDEHEHGDPTTDPKKTMKRPDCGAVEKGFYRLVVLKRLLATRATQSGCVLRSCPLCLAMHRLVLMSRRRVYQHKDRRQCQGTRTAPGGPAAKVVKWHRGGGD
jgi:hypothetical protein